MAKHLLSARQVLTAPDGNHVDGDGLTLRVAGGAASWIWRYTALSGRRRELGLGSADRTSLEAAGASLKRARRKADDSRDRLDAGIDPVDARRQAKAGAREQGVRAAAAKKAAAVTLLRYARAYHEKHVEPVRSTKHALQWINSIEQHVPAALLATPMDAITAVCLLDELVPILRRVPETGGRIYQRLSTIFDAAVIEGLRADNPATPIRRELRKRAGRRERSNFASMSYRRVPEFVKTLCQVEGNSARCLEFLILTAARTSEALTAEWPEIDLQARTWTIPASKMKCHEAHVVYLSDRAVEILEGQAGQDARVVFPSPVRRSGKAKPLSNMALLMMLRRHVAGVTTHGFRASFSTWANEMGVARPDVIEAALAHNEQDRVRRAYNRSEFLRERAGLMVAWGQYLAGREVKRMDGSDVTDAPVLPFAARVAA